MLRGILPLALALAAAAPAAAQQQQPDAQQQPVISCQSQQSLEQVLASGSELRPDDCRELVIAEIPSEHGQLCVIDFSGAAEGVLDTLRAAALPEEWWVVCDLLAPSP